MTEPTATRGGAMAGRIGLAILWAAVAVAFFATGRVETRPVEPGALQRVLEPVARGEGVALLASAQGDVWWVTREQAARYPAGDPGLRETALDPEHYRRRFGRHFDPIVAAHLDAAGDLWLGSRRGEVTRLLQPFGHAAQIVAARHPAMTLVIPTVSQVGDIVSAAVAGWPLKSVVVTEADERRAAMAAADIALAASGTVALELAANGVPAVIGYKVALLTAWMLRRLVRVRHANIVNIIADQEIVPEHLQDDCQPNVLAASLLSILDEPDRRASILAAQAAAIEQLAGSDPPSAQAASVILSVLSEWSGR